MSGPWDGRTGVRISALYLPAVWPSHTPSLPCLSASSIGRLRDVNGLKYQETSWAPITEEVYSPWSCPQPPFFLLEQGRRKQRLPGSGGWALGRLDSHTVSRVEGSFLRAQSWRVTAVALAWQDEFEGLYVGNGDCRAPIPLGFTGQSGGCSLVLTARDPTPQ